MVVCQEERISVISSHRSGQGRWLFMGNVSGLNFPSSGCWWLVKADVENL